MSISSLEPKKGCIPSIEVSVGTSFLLLNINIYTYINCINISCMMYDVYI